MNGNRHTCRRVCFFVSFIMQMGFAVHAQSIDENIKIRSGINSMFEGVSKSKVPTRLLLDYAIDLVELSNYDGTSLTDSNYISLVDYENILRSIRSASVSTSKPFKKVDDIIELFTTTNDDHENK